LTNSLFVELQIRTRLQHAWATAVETIGTFFNYALKASEGPEPWLAFFSLTGSAFAHLEGTPAVPGYEGLSKEEAFSKVIESERALSVKDKLLALTVAAEKVHADRGRGGYHLIVLNPFEQAVTINTYSAVSLDEANREYAEVERRIAAGEQIQAVLVRTGPIEELRRAYPNYFLDTREFAESLAQIEAL
jgi:putative GTP pyrophosphokinase